MVRQENSKKQGMEGAYTTYHILKYVKINVYSWVPVQEKNDRTMKQNRSPEIQLTTNENVIKDIVSDYDERWPIQQMIVG